MAAFIIWAIMGIAFIILGIYDYSAKTERPFGFWANAETLPVKDVQGYNRALGILFVVFGVVFTLLGLPLLSDAGGAMIIIPILGTMAESIAAMAVYVTVIEKKYKE